MNCQLQKLFLLAGFALAIAACAINATQENVPVDWEEASYIERGNYLVNHLGDCIGCHTPRMPDGQADRSLLLSGVPAKYAGVKEGPTQVAGFPGPRGARIYAKYLTSYAKTGIGKRSEDQSVSNTNT